MGQLLRFEVVLTNIEAEAVTFEHGQPFWENITVFNSSGEQVTIRHGDIGYGGSRTTTLGSGEKVRHISYWDLTDRDGFALPPGDYFVRAKAHMPDTVDGYYRGIDLATRPYDLTIQP